MEDNLIKRLQAGDEQAFRDCVERYQDRVLNTCYRFVHRREDAEDLMQEVFVELHHSIRRFREDAEFSTWIYRIAVNKSLDFIRRGKRKKRLGFLVSLSAPMESDQGIQIADDGTPESEMEAHERANILQKAVENLPENQKIAVTLSKYEGFSYKEISRIMGTSVSAVESLIHRGMRNLRKGLARYYHQL